MEMICLIILCVTFNFCGGLNQHKCDHQDRIPIFFMREFLFNDVRQEPFRKHFIFYFICMSAIP